MEQKIKEGVSIDDRLEFDISWFPGQFHDFTLEWRDKATGYVHLSHTSSLDATMILYRGLKRRQKTFVDFRWYSQEEWSNGESGLSTPF